MALVDGAGSGNLLADTVLLRRLAEQDGWRVGEWMQWERLRGAFEGRLAVRELRVDSDAVHALETAAPAEREALRAGETMPLLCALQRLAARVGDGGTIEEPSRPR